MYIFCESYLKKTIYIIIWFYTFTEDGRRLQVAEKEEEAIDSAVSPCMDDMRLR